MRFPGTCCRRCSFLTLLTFVFFAASSFVRAQDAQQPAPDNSKTNQVDRDQSSATADQQKMNPADRELTRKIRSAIMSDKSLSTYAHNVKIISREGKVTLKGPVRSDDEKAAVLNKATDIAGQQNVIDELQVAPKKS